MGFSKTRVISFSQKNIYKHKSDIWIGQQTFKHLKVGVVTSVKVWIKATLFWLILKSPGVNFVQKYQKCEVSVIYEQPDFKISSLYRFCCLLVFEVYGESIMMLLFMFTLCK